MEVDFKKAEAMLVELKNLSIELRNNPRPLSKEFWESENKRMAERQKQHEREVESLKMSYEKLHQPFTI